MIINSTIQASKRYMSKALGATKYEWRFRPALTLDEHYGMYINVPFCKSVCGFCPFYKTRYSTEMVAQYVDVLLGEIQEQKLPGDPMWIYMGGGTPNVLQIDQLAQIVEEIKQKCSFNEAGIELKPNTLDQEYITALGEMGFSKISLGLESFNVEVNQAVKRKPVQQEKVEQIMNWARQSGLFVNTDLIVGLQEQNDVNFIQDVQVCANLGVDQITIYPYMSVKGLNNGSAMPELQQFALIEQAAILLLSGGYTRLSPWTFSRKSGEYDCAKAELIKDYVGFGAGSFSTTSQWKVVNPPVEYYLGSSRSGNRKAMVAPKQGGADQWRYFGRLLMELALRPDRQQGFWINLYVRYLRMNGYSKGGRLTSKGMYLAHALMKTIVENLPFPIQNHHQISNATSYLNDISKYKNKEREGLAEIA